MAVRRRLVLSADVRRQQLLRAAAWVFARRGYRRAGISDIIARAGVARGTFYLYFDSKEHVFLALADAFHGRARRVLAVPAATADMGTNAADSLIDRCALWLRLFADDRDAARVMVREASAIDDRLGRDYEAMRTAAVAAWSGWIAQLQHLGLLRPDLTPEFVARVQLGMLDELVIRYVLTDPAVDADVLAGDAGRLLWLGVRPE